MSEGLNRWLGLGNLGADPELRFTQGGSAVLNMRLAVTESYLDKDKVRRERTEWVSVVIFGKRGEALSKILSKGSQIFVEGSLRTSSYEDKEGTKRYRTEVVATNVILAGGKRKGESREERAPQEGYAPRAERDPYDMPRREVVSDVSADPWDENPNSDDDHLF